MCVCVCVCVGGGGGISTRKTLVCASSKDSRESVRSLESALTCADFYSSSKSKYILLITCTLFDFILYVPSTIFQLYRDGSSWVEPVLS